MTLAAHETLSGGPFRSGEFSWWLLGDLAPLVAQAILDRGGRVWCPIERDRRLITTTRDGAGNPVSTHYEFVGYKPRWLTGCCSDPNCAPLWDSRCDTKWSLL
jgi:hypothetical protein